MATTAFGAVGSATTIYTSAQADAQFPAYSTSTFTPTISAPSGTTPQYSTNTGQYTVIGNRCFVNVLLDGDGGNEGVGANAMTLAVPFTINASSPAGNTQVGQYVNGAGVGGAIFAVITASASVITMSITTTATAIGNFGGSNQNSTTRTIRVQFWFYV